MEVIREEGVRDLGSVSAAAAATATTNLPIAASIKKIHNFDFDCDQSQHNFLEKYADFL
jgi:hypothetical protein